jgi:hypothetical protein
MGIAYNPRIVTDGLVLALDAGNVKSYPGSGTTWTDLSGRGNNGTLTNMDGTNFSIANGGYLSFDGTNEYVPTSTLSTQFLTTGLTISIWLYYNSLTGNDNVISWMSGASSGAFDGTGYAWELRLRGPTGQAEFSPGIGPGGSGIPARLSYNPPIPWNGRISCIDITFVANGLSTLYENGVSRATQDYSGIGVSSVTRSIWVGRGNNTYFPGRIYSVKIYNRALTAAEIQQNFNATRGRYGI